MRWVWPIVISLVLLSSSRAETRGMVADPPPREARGPVEPQPDPQPLAQAEAPSDAAQTYPHWQWYGWQVLLADLATVGAAVGSDSGEVAIAGYLALPMAVHLANGNPGRAAGSVGVRLALPVLGANVADRGEGDLGAFVVGMMAGALLASMVDVAALSWNKPGSAGSSGATRHAVASAPARGPWYQPTLQPLPRGLSAGIVGGF